MSRKEAHNDPGSQTTDYRFTGKRWQGDIGLYYYGARWYDHPIGRCAQADSIVPEPGNPQSLNRYSYALNNPVESTDPTGHWVESALDIAFIGYDLYDINANGLTWTNGLSLAADVAGLALPVVTGGGLLVRGLAHANEVAKVVSHADDLMRAASRVDDAARVAGQLDNVADAAKTLPSYPCSFDAGTLLLTPGGLTAVERPCPGDTVLAYDEALGATGVHTVTHRLKYLDSVTIVLTVDGESIDTTPERPFYIFGGTWMPAGELIEGDLLRRADGSFGLVESVRLVVRPALMYNLTVSVGHTFFVGEEGWLVHNTCGSIHGNSRNSTKPQHGYEIYETGNGNIVKTGISGTPLTKDGKSKRAKRQVQAWNWVEGKGKYDARVVKTDMPNRAEALK